MRKDVCIRCNKYIELGAEICPYCGMNQFDEEFLAEQAKEDAKKLLKTLKKKIRIARKTDLRMKKYWHLDCIQKMKDIK